MSALRKYIRGVIIESRFKQMRKAKFTDLKGALEASSFLDADPDGDGDDFESWSSEASIALRDTLNDYFDSKFGLGEINTTVKVSMLPDDPSAGVDSVLKGATYYYDDFHNVEVILASLDDGSVIRDMGDAAQKAYEVIMHELLHMQQFLKFSKGEPTVEKWDQFMAEYQKRGGSSGMGSDYFFFDQQDGASELETFSFQMSLELVNALGKKGAVDLLKREKPDFDTIRKNSASFRDIEKRSPDISRPELTAMVRRAKQYAKQGGGR